jgi:hypothetical protein
MAISQQSMVVAECDAPSCSQRVVAAEGEQLPGYHVNVEASFGGGKGASFTVFAHSRSHVGPAVQAALRQLQAEHGDDEGNGLDGPIVPQRPTEGGDEALDDGADDDQLDDDGNEKLFQRSDRIPD